jgi:hypothetical protein
MRLLPASVHPNAFDALSSHFGGLGLGDMIALMGCGAGIVGDPFEETMLGWIPWNGTHSPIGLD